MGRYEQEQFRREMRAGSQARQKTQAVVEQQGLKRKMANDPMQVAAETSDKLEATRQKMRELFSVFDTPQQETSVEEKLPGVSLAQDFSQDEMVFPKVNGEQGNLMAAFKQAGKNLGMDENEQNAALKDFLKTGGQNIDPAQTAWCAGFVNAALKTSGIEGTNKLNARSFLDWGKPVNTPEIGDIVVFSRGDPNGWQGHVGFYAGEDENGNIKVLGGNQSNKVSIASYSRDRLLGIRRI